MKAIVLAFAALLLAPGALGAWRAAGGLEPDTDEDRAGGRMFLAPDTGPGGIGAVYFQAFTALPQTSQNPNVGLTGARLMMAPSVHHRAMLGVWKDCNQDGYIGHAESALQDYPSALLLDTTPCPPTRYAGVPVHNDHNFVRELLAIGMVDPCEFSPNAIRERDCPGVDAFALNERVHYANGTYVWADLGAPGSIPKTECVLAPLPSGTTASTGAMIGWADCQSRRGAAHAVNDLDEGGALGLRFEDPQEPGNSGSHLNQRFPVTLFGRPGQTGLLQEDTDDASATLWDCGSPPVLEARDPQGRREIALTDPTGQLHAERFPLVVLYTVTGVGFEDEDRDPATPGVFRRQLTDADGRYAVVPAPDPRMPDPTASWWAALEALADGPVGGCDPDTSSPLRAAYPGAAIESDARPILEARKDRTSLTFTFFDGHRGLHPSLDPYTGDSTPSDGGLMVLDHTRGGDGPIWSATAASDQDPQLVDRDDLGLTPALYFTYYAKLGDAAFAAFRLPTPAPATYGAENCGEHTSGLHLGWICDPTLWWRDANGHDNAPQYAQGHRIGRVPGDPYHLRDVDCYDGELVRGLGVRASLADLSGEASCPAPDPVVG